MATIKELAPKPSDALKAMVDGVRNYEELGLELDMGTFGCVQSMHCFGCAATCTLLKMCGKTARECAGDVSYGIRGYGDLRYPLADESPYRLKEFEDALDRARRGRLEDLFHWYGVRDQVESLYEKMGLRLDSETEVPLDCFDHDWFLEDEPDEEELEKIERFVEDVLVPAGL